MWLSWLLFFVLKYGASHNIHSCESEKSGVDNITLRDLLTFNVRLLVLFATLPDEEKVNTVGCILSAIAAMGRAAFSSIFKDSLYVMDIMELLQDEKTTFVGPLLQSGMDPVSIAYALRDIPSKVSKTGVLRLERNRDLDRSTPCPQKFREEHLNLDDIAYFWATTMKPYLNIAACHQRSKFLIARRVRIFMKFMGLETFFQYFPSKMSITRVNLALNVDKLSEGMEKYFKKRGIKVKEFRETIKNYTMEDLDEVPERVQDEAPKIPDEAPADAEKIITSADVITLNVQLIVARPEIWTRQDELDNLSCAIVLLLGMGHKLFKSIFEASMSLESIAGHLGLEMQSILRDKMASEGLDASEIDQIMEFINKSFEPFTEKIMNAALVPWTVRKRNVEVEDCPDEFLKLELTIEIIALEWNSKIAPHFTKCRLKTKLRIAARIRRAMKVLGVNLILQMFEGFKPSRAAGFLNQQDPSKVVLMALEKCGIESASFFDMLPTISEASLAEVPKDFVPLTDYIQKF